MATQPTNNDNTDISGEFSTTDLEVSNFCGSFTGYLKGFIKSFLTLYLYFLLLQ